MKIKIREREGGREREREREGGRKRGRENLIVLQPDTLFNISITIKPLTNKRIVIHPLPCLHFGVFGCKLLDGEKRRKGFRWGNRG